MQSEFEEHWKNFPLTFTDCSEEMAKDSAAVRIFADERPRELRHAHPDWLNDYKSVADVLYYWHKFYVRTNKARRKLFLNWTKFFFKPLDSDLWFWRFHFNLYEASDRPKIETDSFKYSVAQSEEYVVLRHLDEDHQLLTKFVKTMAEGQEKRMLVAKCFRLLVESETHEVTHLVRSAWISKVWSDFVLTNGDIGKRIEEAVGKLHDHDKIVAEIESSSGSPTELLLTLSGHARQIRNSFFPSEEIASSLNDLRLTLQYEHLQKTTGIYVDEDAKSDGGKL